MMVKLYAAPMEGITGYVWRRAHREIFGGADRYFAPFVTPDANLHFQTKELRELTQNESDLVPQVLVNRGDYFIWAARELKAMGYDEVNLNIGCPSGTVTAKHKGSGMLRDCAELDRFLGEIFSEITGMKISVKTRIGISDTSEWDNILKIFEQYPIHELTIHPRLQKQFYEGIADREIFAQTLNSTKLSLVYNGDVYTAEDEAFSFGCPVMAGRGIVSDPALFRRARGGKCASREELIDFHNMLVEGYREYMPGELPLVYRMREFWHYYSAAFIGTENAMKRMMKAKKYADYRAAADSILKGCELK